MNAIELADELKRCLDDGSTDLVCVKEAAEMLLQQEMDIKKLKEIVEDTIIQAFYEDDYHKLKAEYDLLKADLEVKKAIELVEILKENPTFITSLQNRIEEQEKEIEKLKDKLGIQNHSDNQLLKAVSKIKEQAKEIEQLKLRELSAEEIIDTWKKFPNWGNEQHIVMFGRELLKKANEK